MVKLEKNVFENYDEVIVNKSIDKATLEKVYDKYKSDFSDIKVNWFKQESKNITDFDSNFSFIEMIVQCTDYDKLFTQLAFISDQFDIDLEKFIKGLNSN